MADENKELNSGLYGRLPIYTTIDEFDPANTQQVISEVNEALSIHVMNLMAMEYLYWYRRGVTPIYAKTKEVRPEINHKVSENIYGSIVDFKNGYFLTQPAFYISRKEDEEVTEKVKQLNEYLYVSGKQQADNEIVDWFHTVGKGDLFVRSNDDPDVPYEAYSLDPRSAFVVKSLSPGNPVVYGVHIAVKDEKLFLDVWDKRNVYRLYGTVTGRLVTPDPTYVCTATSVEDVAPNPIGEVPIIEYQYNSVGMSAAEAVVPLLDAINDLQSGRLDSIDQFVQSLLIFYNCELGADENGNEITTKMVREAGALFLKSIGENRADVKELSSVLDQGQTQVLVDDLYKQVLKICGMPDNARGGTAFTGTAVELRDGWEMASMAARNTEDLFKKSNKEFDKIVLKILRGKGLLDIGLNDFTLNFTRTEVDNIQSKAQAYTSLVAGGMHPILAMQKTGVSADPVGDYEMSKGYMKLRWGDPDAPSEQPKTEIVEEDNQSDVL